MRFIPAVSVVRIHLPLPNICYFRPVGQEVKTPPFHGGITSSILVRVTITSKIVPLQLSIAPTQTILNRMGGCYSLRSIRWLCDSLRMYDTMLCSSCMGSIKSYQMLDTSLIQPCNNKKMLHRSAAFLAFCCWSGRNNKPNVSQHETVMHRDRPISCCAWWV